MVQFDPRGDLDELSQVHDRDPVADVPHHGEVVSDEEIGEAKLFLEFFQEVDDLGLDRHVQSRYRLVADDEARLYRQGPGDADPLPLPPAEFMGVPVGHGSVQAHSSEKSCHLIAIVTLLPGQFVNCQGLADDVADRHPGVERAEGVLEDHLHPAAQPSDLLFGNSGDILPFEKDLSSCGALELQHGVPRGCLAAAALPHQAEGFALLKVEIDAVHGLDVADLLFENIPGGDRKVDLEVPHFN